MLGRRTGGSTVIERVRTASVPAVRAPRAFTVTRTVCVPLARARSRTGTDGLSIYPSFTCTVCWLLPSSQKADVASTYAVSSKAE